MSTAPELSVIDGGAAAKRGYTLFERAALAKQELAEAKARFDALVAEIRESNDYGTTEEAGVVVTVGHNPVFQKDVAVKLFGDKVKEYVATPAAAKRALGTDDLAKCYREGEKRVTVDRQK